MPRNRKRKPPADPVEARVSTPTPEHASLGSEWWVHCAHCGQHLVDFKCFIIMTLKGIPVIGWQPIRLRVVQGGLRRMFESDTGWRWDANTWRPTAEHVARRQHARRAVSQGEYRTPVVVSRDAPVLPPNSGSAFPRFQPPIEESGDALRARLRYGLFHRSNTRDQSGLPKLMFPGGSRMDYRLPTRIKCPACDAINIVDAVELRAKLTKKCAVG